ncbi:hypothetical protein GCM10025867_48480 (plasmid) [Frondihabitans sucicola]|uniref:Uncharacterized protein n=1 Tax=Frondihabitans sucicola TaxID=1268041 RepID=A0ABM8GVU5_9MICO|nr:hypothetical protein [Frondihabitans sucicola]BDZ52607.1 hypothetical protein GCM10025867_48480 [Frondihabitans sucicola]
MSAGALVDTVAMPIGITELVARTHALSAEFGEGLVAIQYDEATLGIFTPASVIACPTCGCDFDSKHARHSAPVDAERTPE